MNIDEIALFFYEWKKYAELYARFGARNPNTPEVLSESLACEVLNKIFNNDKFFKASDKGDIVSSKGIRVEVKASQGYDKKDCSSFGPKEKFDMLVYVKLDFKTNSAKVYDCHMNFNGLQKIQLTQKGETFEDQCKSGRRPRFSIDGIFKERLEQLAEINFTKGGLCIELMN